MPRAAQYCMFDVLGSIGLPSSASFGEASQFMGSARMSARCCAAYEASSQSSKGARNSYMLKSMQMPTTSWRGDVVGGEGSEKGCEQLHLSRRLSYSHHLGRCDAHAAEVR